MPVAPTRASYQFSSRSVSVNPRLASVANRQFFQSSRVSSPALRSSQSVPSRFDGANTSRSTHGVAPNMQSGYNGRAGLTSTSRQASGWQRFGDPGNAGTLRQSFAGGSEQSAWHRFGQPQRQSFASPSPTAPREYQNRPSNSYSGPAVTPRAFTPNYSGGRTATPSYNIPRYNAPNYSAPRYSAPTYNTPRYNAPSYGGQRFNNSPSYQHYSTPNYQRYSAPSNSGSSRGGGSSSSRGSGSSHSSGGGGGNHSSGGGGGHHR